MKGQGVGSQVTVATRELCVASPAALSFWMKSALSWRGRVAGVPQSNLHIYWASNVASGSQQDLLSICLLGRHTEHCILSLRLQLGSFLCLLQGSSGADTTVHPSRCASLFLSSCVQTYSRPYSYKYD